MGAENEQAYQKLLERLLKGRTKFEQGFLGMVDGAKGLNKTSQH